MRGGGSHEGTKTVAAKVTARPTASTKPRPIACVGRAVIQGRCHSRETNALCCQETEFSALESQRRQRRNVMRLDRGKETEDMETTVLHRDAEKRRRRGLLGVSPLLRSSV